MGRTLESSLQVWFANNVSDTPSTIAGQVHAIGGTAAAAKELGVSQRTVQRWIKGEQGKGGETRKPSEAAREKLQAGAAEKQADNLRDKIAKNGMQGKIEGLMKKSDYFEDREIDVEIDGDDLLDMLDAIAAGKWGDATEEFNAAFFEAYNLDETFSWLDVDGFEFGIG